MFRFDLQEKTRHFKSILDDPLATKTSNCLNNLLGTDCGGKLITVWLNESVEQKQVTKESIFLFNEAKLLLIILAVFNNL